MDGKLNRKEMFKRDLSESNFRQMQRGMNSKTLRGTEFFDGLDFPYELRQKQREKKGLYRAKMKMEAEKGRNILKELVSSSKDTSKKK